MTRPLEPARWAELDRLFAHVPLADRAKDTVFALVGAPDRTYHGPAHLALLWERHERYAAQAGFDSRHANTLVACSIAFHDCIYNAARRDNEMRSADTWMRISADGALSEADRLWVAETIRATADHLSYGAPTAHDGDLPWLESLRLWVLDLDLTPFGETPDTFDRNTSDLRVEHRHLSPQQWEANRLRMLRRFAAMPALYRSPVLKGVFEDQARRNIERQLALAGSA